MVESLAAETTWTFTLLKRPPNQEFERQMLPHLDAAYNFARWMLRHAEDAEDAVQDAYLRAYRAFPSCQGGSEKTWLMTIVRNVCLSRLKRRVLPSKVVMLDEAMREVDAIDAGCAPASLTEFAPRSRGVGQARAGARARGTEKTATGLARS